MQHRILGKTGMSVSVLGFGGAEIGFEKPDIEAVSRLLNAAIDAGLNALDTAECYWAGSEETASEHLIGQTIAHRRSEYFLFTKCGHASGIDAPDWSPQLLTQSLDRSLKRLHTDCVDLLQLHTCNADVLRQGDVITVLQQARDAGKTRFIGYSGDGENAKYAIESGAFDTLQTSVNVMDQECITKTLPLAAERDMGVIAKRPIANAVWRHTSEADVPEYRKSYWGRMQKLGYDFLKTGDTDAITRTALRFALSAPGVTTAIVGTKNPERWAQNAALLADGATLSEMEFAEIRDRWQQIAEPDWVGQT
ncbi:MAG: aldo/keto reductase [Fibrella sp.]|nr:aldo/keto reductase [Armatimonadota bacterium]